MSSLHVLMLTVTDLCSGVPKQPVFMHTPSCLELDWVRIAWISEECPPVHLPHTTRLAEEWFCPLEMSFCVLQWQKGSAFSHLEIQVDVREDGHHLSSGGLKLVAPAGLEKAGCYPEDRDCLVGCGSWEWSNDGVLSPVLTVLASGIYGVIYFVGFPFRICSCSALMIPLTVTSQFHCCF